jgi:signal transduction histidine kinase
LSSKERALSRVALRVRAAGVGTLLGATIGVLLVLAILGIGLALLANRQLTDNRNLLLEQVGPARRAALNLENALVNEETGVRGYLITAQPTFLEPYRSGLRSEAGAYSEMYARKDAIGRVATAEVGLVRDAARAWRRGFAEPVLARTHGGARRPIAADLEGKRLFDAVRTSLSHLQGSLNSLDLSTRAKLNDAADTLALLLIVAAVLILGGILTAGVVLRRTITRPLADLGAEARRVAGGEFTRPLAVASGPREIADLGSEIDAMRERIVTELATVETARMQVEEQARELQRSNSELEQFAYVASHDLQEPLRKVASFCQALQSRYGGQLDERADQYIEFAVDGAKRMQELIGDLLAFSRVGRSGREHELIELDEVLATAQTAAAAAVESAGALVVADDLPVVSGERAQLVSLFQNLISNAVKFRGEEPPVVRIEASRSEREWQLSFADNGIGIEREYAERIFLIFQRLHARDAYSGSGIGLALCRKIVEYHGGRIWLDTDYTQGACFRLTLPIADEAAP